MQKEYNKWKMMQNILRKLSPAFYDLYNHPPGILEIWIINMLSEHGIERFDGNDSLDYKYLESQLIHTGKKNQIEDYKEIINYMLQNYRAMDTINTYEPFYKEVNGITTFYYGKFNKSIESERAKILLKLGSLEEVICMIIRYGFISVRGSHQWSCPEFLYSNLIKFYNIQIEGFGSPLNSRLMMIFNSSSFFSSNENLNRVEKEKKNIEGYFCSLFPDTDKKFGSLGNFFKQDFTGKRVFINPPFIPNMIDKIRSNLEICLTDDKTGLYIIDIPEWPEQDCYKNLMSSKFLRHYHTFEKGEHYYMQNEKKIYPTFKSTFFLLSGLDVKNDLSKLYTSKYISGNKEMKDTKINFFTWNILTRSYFTASSYKDSDPENFDLEKRDNFIIDKLKDLMDENYIISLQEVDLTVWNKIALIFNKHNYQVYWSSYGNYMNDFMGVLLAWPKDLYNTLDYKQCVPPSQAKDLEPKEFLINSPWSIISKRWNWLLMAKLEEIKSKKKIVVATYHAPLFSSSPDATLISTDLYFHNLENFAKGLPVIIGGDFNFSPSSDSFDFVTSNKKKNKEILVSEKKFTYQPKTKLAYKSAYNETFGNEPDFTNRVNRTYKIMNTESYEDTLDFIFFTNFKPKKVKTKKLNQKKIWYPNLENPSDHLPMQTIFYI